MKFTGSLCHLPVADLETAKQIESLRAANQANLQGTLYFFIRQIEDGNRVDAVLTGATYEVWDKPTYASGRKRVAVVEVKP